MNTEYKSNVRMAPEIKILSIWRARKMNLFNQNVNFRCSISGDFGLHMQFFPKMTKVEKSFENEVRGISRSVFNRKWCAALSSVVCLGEPEGPNLTLNANS